MKDVLKDADSIINGPRAESYGDATESFQNIATIWSIQLKNKLKGARISPKEVALMMAGLKLVRESNKPQYDNILDAVGYLALHEKIMDSPVTQDEMAEYNTLICKNRDMLSTIEQVRLNYLENKLFNNEGKI